MLYQEFMYLYTKRWPRTLDLISCFLLKDVELLFLLSCCFWQQLNVSFLLGLAHPMGGGRIWSSAANVIHLGILYHVCQSLEYWTRPLYITRMSSEKMTSCCKIVSCLLLYSCILYCNIVRIFSLGTWHCCCCLSFLFPVDKNQADALCYLHNKHLGGSMEESVAFSGVAAEQWESEQQVKKSALEQSPSRWHLPLHGAKAGKLLWELELLKSTANEIPTGGKNLFLDTSPSMNTG